MGKFLNILYPRRCPVCHQILGEQGILVCRECEDRLHPIITDYCLKCGRPVATEVEFCQECRTSHREFDRGRGVFLYNNRMRQSLLHYKYYGNREYGEYYAASICRYMEREIRVWNPDLIIPVPMYPRKKRERIQSGSGSCFKDRQQAGNPGTRLDRVQDPEYQIAEKTECCRKKAEPAGCISGHRENERTQSSCYR